MAPRYPKALSSEEENTKRRERAQRILDAAAELIKRWGYNKTTIDDVAKLAGVAKGTIYLHWKTREELFNALMKRENAALSEEIKQRINDDPEGATLHSVIKHALLATMKNPLMKAVLLRDTNILGDLTRLNQDSPSYEERLASFKTYIELLQQQGVLRNDLSLRQHLYIVSAVSMGVLLIEQFLPDEFKVSDEEAADLLSETIRRTLETYTSTSTDTLHRASLALNQYMDQTIQVMQEESRQEIEH